MGKEDELREAGKLQANLCARNGSPTYAAIIATMVENLASGRTAIELLRADGREAVSSALYLRLLGAVNRLVLTDEHCALRQFYPSVGGRPDTKRVSEVFFGVVERSADFISKEMAANVQTNEVGRSAPLSAAFNLVAETSGRALELLEIGASAGLNLWPDRYRVCAGERCWGPADSPVQLCGHFVSGSPPAGGFDIVSRSGCDLQPLNPTEPSTRLLLRSFIWPEHVGRLRRLDTALSAATPVTIMKSDAVSWIRQRLTSLRPGVTTVVFHSIVSPYLSAEGKKELTSIISEAGARADHEHQFAWISLEPNDSYAEIELVCERWPRHERTLLATSNAHGENVRWLKAA